MAATDEASAEASSLGLGGMLEALSSLGATLLGTAVVTSWAFSVGKGPMDFAISRYQQFPEGLFAHAAAAFLKFGGRKARASTWPSL